jgi:glycosyltransferase involved in cell wall biosynthesis
MNEKISTVIPLYNHAMYIEDAIESVFDQSAKPFEIIVVDDGSTDDSEAIMRKLCTIHPEIIFWSQPNQGAHYTINAGIHRARGEVVSILNSDDTYHPARFEECLKVFDSSTTVSAVVTGLSFIDEAGNQRRNPWYEDSKAFYEKIGDLSLALINGNFFMTTSNLMIRRSVFKEIGYFSALRYTHDLDFFLRLLAHDKQIYLLDKPLLNYRIHQASTIREDHSKVRVEWAGVTAFFLDRIWKNPDSKMRNWGYLQKLIEITDRHNLTRSLVFFLAHIAKSGLTSLECEPVLGDDEFHQLILKVVG